VYSGSIPDVASKSLFKTIRADRLAGGSPCFGPARPPDWGNRCRRATPRRQRHGRRLCLPQV